MHTSGHWRTQKDGIACKGSGVRIPVSPRCERRQTGKLGPRVLNTFFLPVLLSATWHHRSTVATQPIRPVLVNRLHRLVRLPPEMLRPWISGRFESTTESLGST